MDAVLEDVLSGRVMVSDLTHWLKSDTADIPSLRSVKKSEFIPFFLNYMRDKCSWLLSKSAKSAGPILTKRVCKKIEFETTNERKFSENLTCTDVKNTRVNEIDKSFGKIKLLNGAKIIPAEFGNRKLPERSKNVLNEIRFSSNENVLKPSRILDCSKKSQERTSGENIQYEKKKSLAIPDINSLDAFPPVGSKKNDNKGRRRITPTPVQVANSGSSSFGHTRFTVALEQEPNDAFKATSVQETKGSDLHHERELLKITRNKLSQSTIFPKDGKEFPLIQGNIRTSKCLTQYVQPDPWKLCFLDKISVFTEIYDIFLVNAFVPNVTSELYFMFELMTSQVTENDQPNDKNSIFCSIHNCIYFAISVMEKRIDLLHMLDNATLASMVEIPFLFKFSPQLVNFLQVCCSTEQEISTKSYHLKSVPFLLEEDSRNNFPDDNSFYNFKKQRDLFYELLREWQQQSLDYTNSKFFDKFNYKAKLLVNLGSDSVNLYHLAKLIQSQLIASCLCLEVNEVYDDFLGDIQKNFPGKIEKLQERFRMPLCVGGPTPPPTFYGIQIFFSELIQAAGSLSLNQHLIDIFVYKLIELNNANILSDNELTTLGTIKEKYIFILHTLRLLGKFLGYLYFLPYKTCKPLPQNMENYQFVVRKHVIFPIDLKLLLKEAISCNKIILTVPWIVEFLSMMDSMAPNLEHVQTVIKTLISIYRGKYFFELNRNFWFVRFVIGWLFDALNFPKKYNVLIQSLSPSPDRSNEIKGIDYVIKVDRQLIHSCCPYLVEFKVLLHNFLNGIKHNTREVRKITPLSTSKPCNTSLIKQQIETQLEENFFFVQPTSLRKTTEFVSERIASKVISKVRTEVTNIKLKTVESILTSQKQTDIVDAHIVQSYDEIQSKVHDLVKLCNKDIEGVMPHLLSVDTKQSVIDACCKISFRLASNKIVEWCDTNLTLDAMNSDIQNKIRQLLKKESDKTNKDIGLCNFICVLRNIILKIPSKSGYVTKGHLIKINSDITESLPSEISLNAVTKAVLILSIDLYITLLVYFPDICDDKLGESFILLWSNFAAKCEMENLFLCSHNVKFLLSSKSFELSWNTFMATLNRLLKVNVLNMKQLELCVNNLNKLDWQDSALPKYLCHFQNILS